MQSFKSFLREDTLQPKADALEIEIDYDRNISKVKNLYDELHEKMPILGKRMQWARVEPSWIVVRLVQIRPEEYSNIQTLQSYSNEIEKVATPYIAKTIGKLVDIDAEYNTLRLCFTDKIPTSKVDCPSVRLTFLNKTSASLKDINKIFTDNLKILQINDKLGCIKSNVLSLLKLKGQVEISCPEKWNTILTPHLKGDRDILKAQEDLIETGLKEYAKL